LANLHEPELRSFRQHFKSVVVGMIEFCGASRDVVSDMSFQRLGLTDAAIAFDYPPQSSRSHRRSNT
jgi:hypothetical protein